MHHTRSLADHQRSGSRSRMKMLADALPPRAAAMQRKAWRHAAKCAREAAARHAGGRVLERPRLTCLSNRLFDTHYAYQKFFHKGVASRKAAGASPASLLWRPPRKKLCSAAQPSQKFSHACELLAAAAPPRAPPAGLAAAPACAAGDCLARRPSCFFFFAVDNKWILIVNGLLQKCVQESSKVCLLLQYLSRSCSRGVVKSSKILGAQKLPC
jgi:hypothetical protein